MTTQSLGAGGRLLRAIAAVLALLPAAAAAQVLQSAEQSGAQLFLENDLFSAHRKSDQWYTNGFKVIWTRPTTEFPDSIRNFVDGWLDRACPGERCQKSMGGVLGQDMFTPRDVEIASPQPNDRPWAGWLYAGIAGQVTGETTQRTFELDLGVVGPWSGAQSVQTRWHRMIHTRTPRGWDNQLKTEPGIMLQYRLKRRYANSMNTFDFIPHTGAKLGNIMTDGSVGGMLRWGQNLSGFGPDRTPTGAAPAGRGAGRTFLPGVNEWYVFARSEARAVLRNIFLDGNTFKDSPRVHKRPLVADVALGISVRVADNFRITYQHTRRSEESTEPGGLFGFGTLMLAYEY